MSLAIPVGAHHNTSGQVLLLDESDLMPRRHSVVVEWEGIRKISGHMSVLDPNATWRKGGDEPMWGEAVSFEFRDPAGWRPFASISGHSAAVGNSEARVTTTAPFPLDVEHGPILRLETGNNTFGWILTGTGGRYRITTWAAGEIEGGLYAFPLWGEAGVQVLSRTEGDDVRWIRADDVATLSAGGSVKNHGVWTRALASVSHTFEHRAYITDAIGTTFQECACRYSGPNEDWDGTISTRDHSLFGGDAGTYSIDVIMSENNRESGPDPFNPTRSPPGSYNDALGWTFADVEPADG